MSAYTTVLWLHMAGVFVKLGLLFYIPFLKDNVEKLKSFVVRYKQIDRYASWSLWITGFGFFFVTSWEFLMEFWLQVSMLLYVLIFYIIKRVILGRMRKIIDSNKVFAREEFKTLRTENYCVIVVSIGLFVAIGALMVVKPSF